MRLFKDGYGRSKLWLWFDKKFVFGYYKKNNTYKNLPRWREIVTNHYSGNSLLSRWVIR